MRLRKRAFRLKDLNPPYGSVGRGAGWCLTHKRVLDFNQAKFKEFQDEMANQNNKLEDALANLPKINTDKGWEWHIYPRKVCTLDLNEKRFFKQISIEPHCQMMLDYRGMPLSFVQSAVRKFLNNYERYMENNYKKGFKRSGDTWYPTGMAKASGKNYPAGTEPFEMKISGYWYVFLAENQSNVEVSKEHFDEDDKKPLTEKEKEDKKKQEEDDIKTLEQEKKKKPYLSRFNTLKVITAYPDGKHILDVGVCNYTTGRVASLRRSSIQRVAYLYILSKCRQ